MSRRWLGFCAEAGKLRLRVLSRLVQKRVTRRVIWRRCAVVHRLYAAMPDFLRIRYAWIFDLAMDLLAHRSHSQLH